MDYQFGASYFGLYSTYLSNPIITPYIYQNGCDALTEFDTTHLSTGCTCTVTANGYIGNALNIYQPNTTANENCWRLDKSGNYIRIFSVFNAISVNVSGESCILHFWSDSYTLSLFEVRLVQNGTGYNVKIKELTGNTVATGTTLLTFGVPYKFTVNMTDTGIYLYLDEKKTVECSITAISLTGKYIGVIAGGEYFANGINGHVYFDNIFLSTAIGAAPSTNTTKALDAAGANGFKQMYHLLDGTNAGVIVRPKTEGNGTTNGQDIVSESQPYGMDAAIQVNDQAWFNQIETWIEKNLERVNNVGLTTFLTGMAWHYDPTGGVYAVLDWNTAHDADMHRLGCLYKAHAKWGSNGSINYIKKANAIAKDMQTYAFATWQGKQYLIADMSQSKTATFEMATSYFMPFAASLARIYTCSMFWDQVIEGFYDAYNKSQTANLDVTTSKNYDPDWNFFNPTIGTVSTDTNSGRESKYEYNAVRSAFWKYHYYKISNDTRFKTLTALPYSDINTYYGVHSSTLAAQLNHDGSLDGTAYEKTQMYAADMFIFYANGDTTNGDAIYNNKVINTYVQHPSGSYFSDNAATNGNSVYFNNFWTFMPVLLKEGTLLTSGYYQFPDSLGF